MPPLSTMASRAPSASPVHPSGPVHHPTIQAEQDSVRGLLLTLAPTLLLFPAVSVHPWQSVVAPTAAVLVLVATWLLSTRTLLARGLATLSIVATVTMWLAGPSDDPIASLFLLVATAALIGRLYPQRALLAWQPPPPPIHRLRPAGWLALAVTVGAWFRPWQGELIAAGSLVAVALIPSALTIHHAARHTTRHRIGLLTTSIGLLLGTLHLALWSDLVLRLLPALPVAVLLASTKASDRDEGDALLTTFVGHPPRLLVLSFLALCGVGTLLLALPGSNVSGEGLPILDALFTAVSASCVTGLTVIDVSTTMTWWGQLTILVLMQAGGLGIMTFAAAAFVLLGRRMGVREERSAMGLLGASGRGDIQSALRRVLVVTAASESAGTLLLTGIFRWHGDPWGTALWRGIFTAVSAFCNAGFSLQTHSMIPYQSSPSVLVIVGALITLGGLGPAVVYGIGRWHATGRVGLHVRVVVITSALLSGGATLGFAAFEWHGDLAHLTSPLKVLNAAFQAVSFRTAGFSSVDLPSMHHATWVMVLLIMFIGGSPGSAAGGIKTTTVAVIFLELLATVQGKRQVHAYGRRIPTLVIRKALAVLMMGVASFLLLLLAIQVTQRMALDVAIFEVMSAIATVGASMGGTDQLDQLGKLIVVFAMFTGRVGPLTLLLLLQDDEDDADEAGLPQEALPVG